MVLCNEYARVQIEKVQDISNIQADEILDPENYAAEQWHTILLISVSECEKPFQLLLYCSFLGSYEGCTVLHKRQLLLAKYNTLYTVDIPTGKLTYKHFPDMAGAFRLYVLQNGYLIHGECEVVKLDFNLNTEWMFSGEDIFASADGEECCKVYDDRIELVDFSGNTYTIPVTEDLEKQYAEKEERYCSFKEISENPIILDFNTCDGWRGIHPMLKEKFGLPDYYGENWDALWDCISYRFQEPVTVELHNFHAQSDDLQSYCKPMLQVFADVHEETPYFTYKILS